MFLRVCWIPLITLQSVGLDTQESVSLCETAQGVLHWALYRKPDSKTQV